MKTSKTLFIILGWIVLISASIYWNIVSIEKNMNSIAKVQGQSFFEEIINARAWNALHNGVYVPITDKTLPNPYLKIPNRDIYIDSLGLSLTKVNPAYMTRQIAEIAENKSNVKYHITSLNLIRPANKADNWESIQLGKFEKGEKESFEYLEKDTLFRYMAPLFINESCMACHQHQGYKIGDIRGGISVTINAKSIFKSSDSQKLNIYIFHVALLIIGIVLIIMFQNYSTKQYLKLQRANETISQKNKILRQNESELKESTEQLKQLNKTKDRFFSIIAHDLKNSFASILGFSELLITLGHKKQFNKFEEYSENIKNSTIGAHTLLTNLLEWSRLQTGSLKFDPEWFNIDQVVNDTLAFAGIIAKQKNITITKNIPPGFKIYADKNMISTVLRNLISNAIKYTHYDGKINLRATKSNGNLEFSVSDNGVGVKNEDIKKLFRIDTIFTSPGTNREKGTGLGLILCKDFIKIHKGEIRIDSEEGKGSTILFKIPVC